MISDSSPLILGSSSPRRKEILRYFHLPFEQVPPSFDESTLDISMPPEVFVKTAAREKCLSIKEMYPERHVLAADTIVAYEGAIYGKPKDLEEAKEMLLLFNGKVHIVYTALALGSPTEIHGGISKTNVYFKSLTEEQIDTYIRSVPVLDKAGSYAIQEQGSILIERIEGCFFNVMGLPIDLLEHLLQKEGMTLWNYL